MIDPVVVVVSGRQGSTIPLVALELPFLSGQADFGCTGAEAEFAALDGVPGAAGGVVRAAGALLYQSLNTNDDVKEALGTALKISQNARSPLLLELRKVEPAIEALPWETLYAPGAGFLGLDARWSIGRRVRSDQGQPTSTLAEPLRVAVVLSCLGISAEDEWQQLAAAVEAAPIPVEVLAFVGEPALLETIKKDPPPWVRRLEGVPESASELAATFAEHRRAGLVPHVLHFFCHGSVELSPYLEIATKADWAQWGDKGTAQSSLTLEASEINQLSTPTERPWLVLLSCCQSAAEPGAGTQSLALRLVNDGGYPAVIGMRAPVDAADATTFDACLYAELFAVLAGQATDQPVPPDWSRLLISARRKLAESPGVPSSRAAERRPQWTLPVLYVRYRPGSADFSVTRAQGAAVPADTPAAPVETTANAPLATLLHDLLAVRTPDAPTTWPTDLEALAEMLRTGRR